MATEPLDPMRSRIGADYSYTDEPFPEMKPWDRKVPIDIWKYCVQRAIQIEQARRSPMLLHKNADGEPLYKLTEGGRFSRRFPLSRSRRQQAIDRDGKCVQCGAGGPFEVDHIVRYVDGGSNELDNLQTLCLKCHRKKGGRRED